jgi:hypothetical protein
MELSTSEEALLIAALVSHKFRLKHQLDIFRPGVNDVLREAVEREMDACDSMRERLVKSRSGQ